MELMQAIMGRRSIRSFTAEPVARDDMAALLEAARWAPSWANTQCWQFIIVRDQATREQLAGTLPEQNPARGAVQQAPVVIAACAQKERSGYFKGSPVTDKGDWLLFDVGLALQNLTLAAHACGLGTVHIGFFDAVKAGQILQVPAGVTVVELLPLGHPAAEGRPTPRKEIDTFVFYDRHGQTE